MEELWEGTNSGGDTSFGPAGAKVSVYAFSVCDVRDGKFVRMTAWTGRPQRQQEEQQRGRLWEPRTRM
jgi:hypothetical protein